IEVQKERLSGFNVAFHESFAACQKFSINVTPDIERELFYRPDLPSLLALQNVGDPITLRFVPRVIRPQTFIPSSRYAVPLVKTVIGWPASFGCSNVPLSVASRGISTRR